MFIPDQPLIRNHLYLITWYYAVLALTPLQLRTGGFMQGGGARGQNPEHLRIIFFLLLFLLVWNYSYLNNRYYLGLTLSVTSNLRI